jgi:hypothetical protein
MNPDGGSAEWYYVGHYGQLGPLTLEQVSELAQDGVIAAETYVWKPGMPDWRQAREVDDLRGFLRLSPLQAAPPPTPTAAVSEARSGLSAMKQEAVVATSSRHVGPYGHSAAWHGAPAPRSDKNRIVAGLLNFLPGIGRLYLGYAAHGALQLFTALLCGVGLVWSIIDAVYILAGGVKFDGYGRRLDD